MMVYIVFNVSHSVLVRFWVSVLLSALVRIDRGAFHLYLLVPRTDLEYFGRIASQFGGVDRGCGIMDFCIVNIHFLSRIT